MVQNADALYITAPSPIEQTTGRLGEAPTAPIAAPIDAPIPQPSECPVLLTHIISSSRNPRLNESHLPVRFSLTTIELGSRCRAIAKFSSSAWITGFPRL